VNVARKTVDKRSQCWLREVCVVWLLLQLAFSYGVGLSCGPISVVACFRAVSLRLSVQLTSVVIIR
jgi:hypothetical protein